jgi:hemin uptake protein HemP
MSNDSRPLTMHAESQASLAQGTAAVAAADPRGTLETVRISSDALFAGATEVQIAHHGAVYRLKQTALGKLILTK